MAHTIEYCLNNVDADVRCRLRDREGDETVEQRCLQRCGDCYRDDFLVVDGELAAGGSHAEILSALADPEGAE
jgi:uncharacterized protein YuzB (UPF0349 family)